MLPATPVLILGLLSDLTRKHTDLVVENTLLRQQLIVLEWQIKRLQLTKSIVFLPNSSFPFYEVLETIDAYCSPDTLLSWHGELFRIYWQWKLQGKPNVSSETIILIRKMAGENRVWGAERIRREWYVLMTRK